MTEVKNKNIVITGGASGIGKQMAVSLHEMGGRVAILDINKNSMEQMQRELGIRAYFCDISDKNQVYKIAQEIRNDLGEVDILINNAGIVSGKTLLDCSDEQIEKTMQVNTMALFWTTRSFLPSMIERNQGHIVTVASAAGIIGVCGLADYSASKFAAFGFDESLRMELKKRKSKVVTTVVCPYFIDTGMFHGVKSRFSWILPILQEKKVAQKIVRGILRNHRRILILPIIYAVWPLRILPVALFDWIAGFLGINSSMDQFKGRTGEKK